MISNTLLILQLRIDLYNFDSVESWVLYLGVKKWVLNEVETGLTPTMNI